MSEARAQANGFLPWNVRIIGDDAWLAFDSGTKGFTDNLTGTLKRPASNRVVRNRVRIPFSDELMCEARLGERV